MSFSLDILLYIYLAFLLFWIVFSVIGIYHMLKYGFLNFMTFFSVFIYIIVSIAMLLMSYNLIIQVDWSSDIIILNNIFNSGTNLLKY